MRSRTRGLAALVALIAFALSFAESVWASSCMPGMQMNTATAEAAVPEGDGCMGGMASQAEESGDDSPANQDEPHCPFAPLSTSGSCVVPASLPPSPAAELTPSPLGNLLNPSFHPTRDLLLVSVFFHPPRA